jgi:hypothetical protein
MALYTPEQFKAEILADKEYLLEQTYPQDLAGEYADSGVPVWHSEILDEWRSLPNDYQNRYTEMISELPDNIYTIMHCDLWIYYQEHYYTEIEALVEERDEQERIKQEQETHTLTAEEFFGED